MVFSIFPRVVVTTCLGLFQFKGLQNIAGGLSVVSTLIVIFVSISQIISWYWIPQPACFDKNKEILT